MTDPITAIDIGGTKIAVARVEAGRVVGRHQVPTPRTGRGDDLADAVAGAVGIVTPRPRRVGIATTGIVTGGRLTALNPVTLPVEDGYPLVDALVARFGVRALAVNDAQAAAFHESRQSAGIGPGRLAFVTVSTGIGAGLVFDGRLQVGGRGLAGHAGHIVVDRDGPVCGCGRRGCVETIASGTAIAERAAQATGRPMSAPDVFAAARAGDPACATVLDEAVAALAAMIADLVAACDLDLVRLGGGVGLAPGLLERLEVAVAGLPAVYRRPIEAARGGAEAGLLGVAALLEQGYPNDRGCGSGS